MTSALLQLPLSMPRHEKERRIAAIIEQLVWASSPKHPPCTCSLRLAYPCCPSLAHTALELCCI